MRQPIRVLIFIDSRVLGGPGKGLLQLIRHMDSDGAQFELCNFCDRHSRPVDFINAAAKQGLTVHLLEQRRRIDATLITQSIRLARRLGCDIVQTHGYKTHVLGLVLRRLLGKKWLAVMHGWTDENPKMRVYNALERFLLRLPDAVVAVAPTLYAEACKLRRSRAESNRIILNAVDVARPPRPGARAELRAKYGVVPSELLIGVIGRLSAEKGHELMLEAFREVARAVPHARLLIIGDGPERSRLEAQAGGLRDRITFAGYCTDIDDHYRAIDLVVLPSLSEGLPNVVLESMSFGTPVIATDVGGVREIIEDGENGWIVGAESPAAMAEKIVELSRDPEAIKTVGRRVERSLYPKFSAERRAREFLDVYEWLMPSMTRLHTYDQSVSDQP